MAQDWIRVSGLPPGPSGSMMPRPSASARSGRCGEFGLTLMVCGALPWLNVKESRGRHLGTREIRDTAMRRKRKTRHALSAKPVPDPLPRGALTGEVPDHDRSGAARPGDSQERNPARIGVIAARQPAPAKRNETTPRNRVTQVYRRRAIMSRIHLLSGESDEPLRISRPLLFGGT